MSIARCKQLFLSMAFAASALASSTAGSLAQQSTFSAVYGFGDSYADTGNLFALTHTSSPIYPTGRFSGGTNFVDTIQSLLGVPAVQLCHRRRPGRDHQCGRPRHSRLHSGMAGVCRKRKALRA